MTTIPSESIDYNYIFGILVNDIWPNTNPFLKYSIDVISIIRCVNKIFNTFFMTFLTKRQIEKILFIPGNPYENITLHYTNCYNVKSYTTPYGFTVKNYRIQYQKWFMDNNLEQIQSIYNAIIDAWNENIYDSGMRPTWNNYWTRPADNIILPLTFNKSYENISSDLIREIFSEIIYFKITGWFIDLNHMDFVQDAGSSVIEHNRRIKQWRQLISRCPSSQSSGFQRAWIKSEEKLRDQNYTTASDPLRHAKFVSQILRQFTCP